MNLNGKVVVVTGAGAGIGRALCLRFAADGARVVASDVDAAASTAVARKCGGIAYPANAGIEAEVQALVDHAQSALGPIDLFCANAGIMVEGGPETPDSEWRRILDVNLMAHIYAARAVLPSMLARGEGYLLHTISAAGLLTQIGSAPYAVTKHAALGFAEWLSVTYGDRGIRVSALCPQGVQTGMLLRGHKDGRPSFLLEGSLTPEQVADEVVEGLRAEQFLILPHPEVADYFRRKAADYDRWLRGMRRLQARVSAVE